MVFAADIGVNKPDSIKVRAKLKPLKRKNIDGDEDINNIPKNSIQEKIQAKNDFHY
ncbi:hypothetical protein HMPREF1565_3079 [Providencia alcalifaciens RIMD 1656011]|nr:hypothetical protein HMPREF1565_3079 [Providencia alcalifaciens RIMD 1656011]